MFKARLSFTMLAWTLVFGVLNSSVSLAESYSQKVLSDHPIAFWPLNESTGATAVDASGNGYDGTYNAGVTLGTSGPGGKNAVYFDGSGDGEGWYGAPDNNGITISKSMTRGFDNMSVEAWIKKLPSWWMPIVYRDSWDANESFGLYAEWSSGKVQFGHYAGESYVVSNTEVQDGQWHHVVGTISQENGKAIYRIYVDGKLDAERVGTIAVLEGGSGTLKIGYPNSSGGDIPFLGSLADIAIYEEALSPTKIQQHFMLRGN